MFELMKAQLSNVLQTKRRRARKIFRAIKEQTQVMEKLEKEKKDLDNDINTGDVEAVRKDFEEFLKEYQKAVESSFNMERVNILFLTEEGKQIKEQESQTEKIKQILMRIPENIVSPENPIKYKGENITSTERLKEILQKKYKEWLQVLKRIHDQEKQNEDKIVRQILDQSRNMQHLRDEIFNNFTKYNTEQESRWMRRNIRRILKEMAEVTIEERTIEHIHIKDKRSVEQLLKDMDALIEDTDKEQKDLARDMFRIHSLINLFAIYEYFELMNKYGSEYIQNTLIPRLQHEGYPETDKLVKDLHSMLEEIKKEGTEIRNIALQAQQRT
ncbi:MAG: hypothetical protein ACLFP2_03075 [Candidatus Woesearchaeota archaeon]